MKKIAIGSDHAGYQLKEKLALWLRENSFDVADFGTDSDVAVDYPDIVHPLCRQVEKDDQMTGILLCGSGNGVAMAANKHQGIRAAVCWDAEIASLAKEHNDANVICLPARFIDFEKAKEIINAFGGTEFAGGRHLDRVKKIPV